ncbi:acylphosphatase [Enterococcus saccharolyticus]|uniref:acylphosphatase n=1 Tax=Enterococcus saccharolyticus subsp. saccharolyticus ATCC 43076 TaxID=1139996 RepID=S0JCW3_9ENTE|nr:acylphosphatase [Enterococcus saccharolyticus]EOT30172.1 acylphosphatase [Enterococcus saccharolyticus subsp. saccharolyticus ATCC 43076]EOT80717.1 acylphosphatase [Enterococcus saccharolyticus subsp. saccharolyticus ATCC 43076]
MKKIRMNVQGRVQGVGFRFTTKMLADELGVYGSAMNEDNGSVTIEAMGEDDAMDTFIEKVKASPAPYGRVTFYTIEENATITERDRFITN